MVVINDGMTTTDILEALRQKQGNRSLREFAKEVGCTAAYLSDIYRGNRPPARKILNWLGLVRRKHVKVTYVFQRGKK